MSVVEEQNVCIGKKDPNFVFASSCSEFAWWGLVRDLMLRVQSAMCDCDGPGLG